jgi:hypothetical protein
MRIIYTSKGMSKRFGVRVIYRKIQYLMMFRHNADGCVFGISKKLELSESGPIPIFK